MTHPCLPTAWLLAVALCLPLPGMAGAQGTVEGAGSSLACPDSVTIAYSVAPVAEWQVLNAAPARLPLERIAIRAVPDSATSIPQSSFLRLEQGERRTILASWDLADIRRTQPRLSMACLYAGTQIALARELPPAFTQCEFRVESTGDSLRESASCR